MIESFLSPEIIATFFTLTMLEIVLGIDNLIFITIVADGLPKHQRKKARVIGLTLALVIRIAMLLGIAWIMSLTEPLFTVMETGISFKDLMLLGGGAFLIAKATFEMHHDIGGMESKREVVGRAGFAMGVAQIVFIDFVFSFDSIITAVGLTQNIPVIVAAIVISMIVMLMASERIGKFLQDYPTFKMLALSFILMIGVLLMAEGMHQHVPRGYLYFAFAFSIFVEILNNAAQRKKNKTKR